MTNRLPGALALIGGAEWQDGCETFDRELLEAAGTNEVAVLPTAAAYEHPERAVEAARSWFETLGAKAEPIMVLSRPDADEASMAQRVKDSQFIYLSGGSALHLRSVLKGSAVWEALSSAWDSGAVLAASSAGAMVLGDPMVDPRGGAFTVGLGLVPGVALVTNHDTWPPERVRRTVELAPVGIPVAGIDERTALIRSPDGTWRATGAGSVAVMLDGKPAELSVLERSAEASLG